MATYQDKENLLETCPYDPNHKVAPKRFSIHVAACAKKSTKKLKMCPFNSCHRIEPELFDAHLVSCKNSNIQNFTQMQKDLWEWETLDVKKPTTEVVDLAGRMGAIGIAGPSSESWASTKESSSYADWNTEPIKSAYVIPGLEKPDTEINSAHGENTFHYQNMKPAEKKKVIKKLVEETMERKREKEMAPILEATAEKERIEREKREKAKKEEEERYRKMAEEKEKIKKAREEKQKAKKAKDKAAKRAAFLAKQAAEQNSNENKENSDAGINPQSK